MIKQCTKCKKLLSESNFHKRTKSADGLRHWCKECVTIYNNSDTHKAAKAKYRISEHGKKKEKEYTDTIGRFNLARHRSTEKYRNTREEYQKIVTTRWNNLSESERRHIQYHGKYGITLVEYDEMFEQQNGLCAICNLPEITRRLEVDHNHETGEVRGLLCRRCNQLLGFANDKEERLFNAIKYLNICKKEKERSINYA